MSRLIISLILFTFFQAEGQNPSALTIADSLYDLGNYSKAIASYRDADPSEASLFKIAKSYGAEVPFIRPKELASDSAVRSDVIFHALNYVKENYVEKYDILVFLEPTSPLTSELDINRALEFFISDKCVSLVSISESPTHHPEYAIELDSSSNIIKPFMKDSFKDLAINRQSLIPVYFFDGSLYISGILEFYNYKEFYHEQTKGIQVDALKSLEIDEPLDLLIAEMILKK